MNNETHNEICLTLIISQKVKQTQPEYNYVNSVLNVKHLHCLS